MIERAGELAALATAACWVVTALSFESAGKRIGSLSLNLIRLSMALVPLCLWGLWTRGQALPLDAPRSAWLWLTLSGLVGFTIGDLCLFRAFVLIGPRLATLIMSSVPVWTTLFGLVFLGERLELRELLGIAMTVAGITGAVSQRRTSEPTDTPTPTSTWRLAARDAIPHDTSLNCHAGLQLWQGLFDEGFVAETCSTPGTAASRLRALAENPGARSRDGLRHGLLAGSGVALALGGAIGQAGGLVLSKHGMADYDAFAATQIRVFAGIAGFAVIITAWRWWPRLGAAVHDGKAMAASALGAVFGPFLGVGLSLLAVQLAPTGVAASLMATTPILLLPVSWIRGEPIGWGGVLGALMAVAGVALLML